MKFKVEKDKIEIIEDSTINSGSINYYEIECEFSSEWDNLAIKMILLNENNSAIALGFMDGKFIIPNTISGRYSIGFVGYLIEGETKTKQISTILLPKILYKGAGDNTIEIVEEEVLEPTIWEQYVATIQAIMNDTIDVRTDVYNKYDEYNLNAAAKTTEFNDNYTIKKQAIDGVCTDVQTLKTGVEQDIAAEIDTINGMLEDYNVNATSKTVEFNSNYDTKKQAIDTTAQAVENARQEVATNTAQVSADKEQVAEDKSSVNSTYADFLAQIGSEIATLGEDGKIPMSQIPATATQEIYEVESENELVSLTAQKGDLAELVEEIDGERIVTKTWQLLGTDSTVRANWVTWGTSYAVSAGNASNATNAEDSTKINGKRIISMTKEAYDNAYSSGTLLEDTFYFVEE